MRKRVIGLVAIAGMGAAVLQGVTATVASAVPSCAARFEVRFSPRDWWDAREIAFAAGGHLATIASKAEERCMEAAINAHYNSPSRRGGNRALGISESFWIGGNDLGREGIWRWISDNGRGRQQLFYKEGIGGRRGYSNWNGGEPNNSGGNEDCLELTMYGWYGIEGRNRALQMAPPGGDLHGVWNDANCDNEFWFVIEY